MTVKELKEYLAQQDDSLKVDVRAVTDYQIYTHPGIAEEDVKVANAKDEGEAK